MFYAGREEYNLEVLREMQSPYNYSRCISNGKVHEIKTRVLHSNMYCMAKLYVTPKYSSDTVNMGE